MVGKNHGLKSEFLGLNLGIFEKNTNYRGR